MNNPIKIKAIVAGGRMEIRMRRMTNWLATAACLASVPAAALVQVNAQTPEKAVQFLNEVATSGMLHYRNVPESGDTLGGPVRAVVSDSASVCQVHFRGRGSGTEFDMHIDFRKNPAPRLDTRNGKVIVPWTTANGHDELISIRMAERLLRAVEFLHQSCAVQIQSNTGF